MNTRKRLNIKLYGALVALLFSVCACRLIGPTVSGYDSYAYTQTISGKVEALSLMDMATEDYQLHLKDIREVRNSIQKAYEYEKHRPKNEITAKQWEILTDSTGHLFGGFIVKWRNEKKLGKVYIDEKKKQVGNAFDQIAELESKKIKPEDIK